jgi:hypothetical protein
VLSALTVFAENATDIEGSSMTVKLNGKSGSFRLQPKDDEKEFINIRFSKLEQRKVSNNKINLAPVTWSEPKTSTSDGGADVLEAHFTSTEKKYGSLFEFTCQLFETESEEQNGNETVTVSANSLKFSFSLKDFPPIPEGDGLDFSIIVKSKGADDDGEMVNKTKGQKEAKFASGFIDLPTNAVINGQDTGKDGIEINMVKQGGATYINFYFPSDGADGSFSLEYDPEVVIAPDTNVKTLESGSAKLSISFISLAFIAVAFWL